MAVLGAMIAAVLLIPTSWLHWLLIRRRRVNLPRPSAQESDRSLKPQPIQIDIMADREIQFFDKKKSPHYSLPVTPSAWLALSDE